MLRSWRHRAAKEDRLDGEESGEEEARWDCGRTGGGVQGTASRREQGFWRVPRVERVRAGLRLVEEARWREGGGAREAII